MDFVVLWLKPPINSDVIWKRKADAVIFVSSSSSPRVREREGEKERENWKFHEEIFYVACNAWTWRYGSYIQPFLGGWVIFVRIGFNVRNA